jgi:uncharacterized protein
VSYDPVTISILAAVGLVAGMAGGMLGIGGSVVFIPALGVVFPGVGYGVFAAAALICNVFVGAGGAIGHWRNRRVIAKVVKMIYPLGIVGAVVGVLVANALERQLDSLLWVIFGVVICYMVCNNVRKLFHKNPPAALSADDDLPLEKVTWPRVSGVALPTGFLAGMLGIGGGTYSVPSQQILLDMPQKNAIANSSATMIVFCTIGAIVKNFTMTMPPDVSHTDPLILAALLIPPAVLGAFIGGHLTHKLPDRLVRLLFIAFLLYAGKESLFADRKGMAFFRMVGDWLGG